MTESLTWSLLKVYQAALDDEGASRNWRFGVEYPEREEACARLPDERASAAVVVTTGDSDGAAPVMEEMRLASGRSGVAAAG